MMMAVHAQYLSSNTFRGMRSNILEEFRQFQHQNQNNLSFAAAQMLNVTVFSEPESELTCNASGSRKRTRENQIVAEALKTQQLYHHHHHHHHHNQQQQPKIQFLYEPANDSGTASTSGRSPEMGSYLCNNNNNIDLELEALLRFQNQKLRLMVEETRKKQNRSLLGMIEQQTLKRLQEKETELEKLSRANMELEEKVKQMSAENQMWFNVAKNSEATISSLRLSLEQIILQNAAGNQAVEGFGETDGGGDKGQSGGCDPEAEQCSRVVNLELKQRKSCKGCGGGEAAVLVLPCRHLCLCRDCEFRVHSCPVCNSIKNSTLQVFMS